MANILKSAFNLLLQVLPLIGDAKENKDSEDGGKGNFQWGKFAIQLVRIAGTIAGSLIGNQILN